MEDGDEAEEEEEAGDEDEDDDEEKVGTLGKADAAVTITKKTGLKALKWDKAKLMQV